MIEAYNPKKNRKKKEEYDSLYNKNVSWKCLLMKKPTDYMDLFNS